MDRIRKDQISAFLIGLALDATPAPAKVSAQFTGRPFFERQKRPVSSIRMSLTLRALDSQAALKQLIGYLPGVVSQ